MASRAKELSDLGNSGHLNVHDDGTVTLEGGNIGIGTTSPDAILDVRGGAASRPIISLIQRFYEEFDGSPANRALVKYVRIELGPEKGNSIYLMSLFPSSPTRLASRIAGLPKPKNCL